MTMITRRRFVAGALALPAVASLQACMGGGKPELIDSHIHVWKTDPQYPFAPGANVPPNVDATAETLIDRMTASGVSRAVLIQVIHYKWDNSYLAAVLQRYPNYFRGVARVNPLDPAAPDQLTQRVEEGFRGVRLSPAGTAEGDWISGPLMPPLWSRCEQLKVPMTLLAPATRLPEIARLIDRYPDLTVVIDHMADTPLDQPEQLGYLLGLAGFPNVYVKISHLWSLSRQAYPYHDSFAMLRKVYDAFGAGRLMWGSDHPVCLPYLSYGQAVALYRDHLDFMPQRDRDEILHGTAQRVWF
jgi:L-fuconolactonase